MAFILIGIFASDEEPTAADCEPATQTLLEQVGEGLTVDGGGQLSSGFVAETDVEGDIGSDGTWRVQAAEIDGAGLEDAGDVGLWALAPDDGLIMAVDAVAEEFSTWGEAAQPGSPADDIRQAVGDSAAADQVAACAESDE